jgi:amidase
MAIAEYASYDGLGLAKLVKDKKVKPVELVDAAIERIERHNGKLNAVVWTMFDRAREMAKKKLPDGPFKGVPFLLKDILAFMEGTPCRQGSAFIPAMPSPANSTLTNRFLAAGLVPLGRTNVPEFGLIPTTESRLYGPARNPWNTNHSTGGSSGGSAAAVAAGIVPFAHANDGGGSIRIPASCCGLVGLKPTRARNPLGPDLGDIMSGLVADHVVSRSVRDTAAALDATAGPEDGDPYCAPPQPKSYLAASKKEPGKLKIAVARRKMDGKPFHADCLAAVDQAAKLCRSLGHKVEEAYPEFSWDALTQPFMAIWASGLASFIDQIAMFTGGPPSLDDIEGLSYGLYEEGKKVTGPQYLMSVSAMQSAARQIAKFHVKYDAWLTPTLGSPPLKLGTIDINERDTQKAMAPIIDYVPFTAVQNATGQPAINVPLYWNKDDLPVGVQFVGRFGSEAMLLQLATQLEKAAPWKDKHPKIWN